MLHILISIPDIGLPFSTRKTVSVRAAHIYPVLIIAISIYLDSQIKSYLYFFSL